MIFIWNHPFSPSGTWSDGENQPTEGDDWQPSSHDHNGQYLWHNLWTRSHISQTFMHSHLLFWESQQGFWNDCWVTGHVTWQYVQPDGGNRVIEHVMHPVTLQAVTCPVTLWAPTGWSSYSSCMQSTSCKSCFLLLLCILILDSERMFSTSS